MKICWDNLEGIRMTSNGVFIKRYSASFVYKESCVVCGNPYLTCKTKQSGFCGRSCALSGEGHPFYGKHLTEEHKEKLSIAFSGERNHFFGKKHTEEVRDVIRKKAIGRKHTKESIQKMIDGHKGKHYHSEEWKRHLSIKFSGKNNPMFGKISPNRGKPLSEITRKKLSEQMMGKLCGEKNPNWRGGISTHPYCFRWSNEEFKEYIKERDGYTCLNPYCSKTSNKIVIHHVDYDKQNCNHQNLITVCSSCNSRANFDREWHKSWYQAILHRRYGYNYG